MHGLEWARAVKGGDIYVSLSYHCFVESSDRQLLAIATSSQGHDYQGTSAAIDRHFAQRTSARRAGVLWLYAVHAELSMRMP